MKNAILTSCLIFTAFLSCGQTLKMEYRHLVEQIQAGKITGQEQVDKRKNFDGVLNKKGGYPVLPYDSASNSFKFSYIIDFPGIPPKIVFRRIKEWCALTYADLDAVLRYEDYESGKLITKGYTPLTYNSTYETIFGNTKSTLQSTNCFYTLVFTLKDGKAKVDVFDLRYEYSSAGYSAGTNYIPGSSWERPFSTLFPIIANDNNSISGVIDLINQTLMLQKTQVYSVEQYVKNWEGDYRF